MIKRRRLIVITFSIMMFVIMVGITYSSFTGELKILGNAIVRSSSWKIKFANLQEVSLNGDATEAAAPTIQNYTQIKDYSVTVTSPGDSVSYTFDVVNDGDYDAEIGSLTVPTPTCNGTGEYASTDANNVCNHLAYTLKYKNGNDVAIGDKLESKQNRTLVLKLSYDSTVQSNELAHDDVSISTLGIEINYVQLNKAQVNESDGTTPKEYATYDIGTEKTINGDLYYVIGDKGTSSNYVTLLKANPLTVNEVNTYGTGHINRYTRLSTGLVASANGYGAIGYYSSETCGYINENWIYSGCTNRYNQSEVKYTIDAWASAQFTNNELATDSDGYSARLLNLSDISNLGYVYNSSSDSYPLNSNVPSWSYSPNNSYWYWTMIPYEDDSRNIFVWYIGTNGGVGHAQSNMFGTAVIRPVINVYKSKLTEP